MGQTTGNVRKDLAASQVRVPTRYGLLHQGRLKLHAQYLQLCSEKLVLVDNWIHELNRLPKPLQQPRPKPPPVIVEESFWTN